MPYNESLAQRLRLVLKDEADLQEKEIFGGIGFLIRGNMACGIHKDGMIVRTGPDRYEAALQRPYFASTLPLK